MKSSPNWISSIVVMFQLVWLLYEQLAHAVPQDGKNQILKPYNIPHCDYEDTVNLTMSVRYPNGSYEHQGIIIPPNLIGIYDYDVLFMGNRIPVPAHVRGCICKLKNCIKFCCHPNELTHPQMGECSPDLNEDLKYSPYIYVTLTNGTLSRMHAFNEFAIQEGIPCLDSYVLVPQLDESDGWTMYENGSLMRHYDKEILSKRDYCLTPFMVNNTFILNPLNCALENIDNKYQKLNGVAMLISTPFFILTILVYLLVPELHNLHGKCLVCYLISLAVGYLIIAGLVLLPDIVHLFGNNFCRTLGFTAYFALMSAFFWLSVISFDLWNNFCAASNINVQNFVQQRLFFMYSSYSWGLALLMTLVTIGAEVSDLHESIKPGITSVSCWIKTYDWSALMYFYGPNLLLILFNTAMFILTSLKIYRVKRDLERIVSREQGTQRHFKCQRDSVGLFLRLFMIMGVSWLLEGISYLYYLNANKVTNFWVIIFLITDLCNATQGIFIFVLFVLKRTVLNLVKKRVLYTEQEGLDDSAIQSEEISLQDRGNTSSFLA